MDKNFSKKLEMYKKSIDWWQEESLKIIFEAEEAEWLYEVGELTEEEVVEKTTEIRQKMKYLMVKGMFEQSNLFQEFTNEGK